MSMNDPIADMLTRIRNGQTTEKAEVSMPSSKLKVAIAQVLLDEGYILGYEVDDASVKKTLTIQLKYYEGQPVIARIDRYSSPGLRRYSAVGQIPKVMGGLGTAILSTSKGVMTDRQARAEGVGGEVLCLIA
jgi:small subunit ribosomal protein S8